METEREEVWTLVANVKPRPSVYRTVCTTPGCEMNTKPVGFAMNDTAVAWARNHADMTGHVVAVQARQS